MMQSSQYVALFLDEARLLLEQCQDCLAQLESTQNQAELVRELFRLVHTIKGMSSTLVDLPFFEELTRLSDLVETFLAQDSPLFSEAVFFLFSDTFLIFQELMRNIEHPERAASLDLTSIFSRFEAFQPNHGHIEQALAGRLEGFRSLKTVDLEVLLAQGLMLFQVDIRLLDNCLMPAVRAMLVLHNLSQQGQTLETEPSLVKVREGRFENSFQVLFATHLEADEVRVLAGSVSEIDQVSVTDFELTSLTESASVATVVPINEFEQRVLDEAERQQLNAIWLSFQVRQQTELVSARIAYAFRILETQGEIIKTLPGVQALENGSFQEQFGLLLISTQAPEAVLELLNQQAEIQACFELQACLFTPFQQSQQAELALDLAEPITGPLITMARELDPSPPEPGSERLKNIRLQHLVRVDAQHLKTLSELTGELLLARARLNQSDPFPEPLYQSLTRLNQVSAALQTVSMRLQSITVAQVFNRYPRMVRDLSRSLNKEITCQLSGVNVELARTCVDDLTHVLLHMIRNSADHGLESSEERLRLGKPRQGNILLAAAYQGERVLITVEDDGCGIDIQKLKQKAFEKGLITKDQQSALPDQEALNLIFHPGLSTSEFTTDISGRGVGMDVVQSHVTQMGGTLQVYSSPGWGTRFVLSLPSEVREVEVLLVQAGNQYFAFPNQDVHAICLVHELAPTDLVISLKNLGRVSNHDSDQGQFVLRLEANGKQLWILVDDILGLEQLAIRRLENQRQDMVQGAALMNADDLALYVEPARLVELASSYSA